MSPTTAPQRGKWWRPRALLVVGLLTGLVTSGCAGTPPRTAEPALKVDAALHEQLPPQVRRSGVLTVATDASYAPASFFAPDGRTVIGFEPDLAAALGKVLGVRLRFLVTDFATILDDLRTGRADVVMSAMTDTVERERKADFVNYFSAGTSILVGRGNPHGVGTIQDLCGLVVAVERSTVQVDLLERSQAQCDEEPIRVRTHQTNADALVELRTGRAAAVLNDYPPASYLTTAPDTRAHYRLASNVQYEPGLYGIAVPKDEPALRDAIQAALEQLVDAGEYARVLREWEVFEGAVSSVTVNAG